MTDIEQARRETDKMIQRENGRPRWYDYYVEKSAEVIRLERENNKTLRLNGNLRRELWQLAKCFGEVYKENGLLGNGNPIPLS